MKHLTLTFSLFSSMIAVNVLASPTMTLIKEASITGVINNSCNPGSSCEVASWADVELRLQGCLDSLGPVTAHVEQRRHKTLVYLTAVNVVNPKSAVVRCRELPVVSLRIPLGRIFVSQETTELRMLGSDLSRESVQN